MDVTEFMVSLAATILVLLRNVDLGGRRGWEPGAILNWVALAGWGMKHDHSDGSSSTAKAAPNGTALMTMQEMIQEVRPRRSPVDGGLTLLISLICLH